MNCNIRGHFRLSYAVFHLKWQIYYAYTYCNLTKASISPLSDMLRAQEVEQRECGGIVVLSAWGELGR